MDEKLQAVNPASPGRVTRMPEQKRSRERRQLILHIAGQIIAARGSDHLKMSEVAQRAGISIGSLYQHFADKQAVVWALADQINESSRICIEEALAEVVDEAGLNQAFSALMDTFYDFVRTEPVARDIWAGMQADKDLAQRQLAESRVMGGLLAQAIGRATGCDVTETLRARCLLVWELGEATVRLAISCEPATGAEMVQAYKRMALHEMTQSAILGAPSGS